MKGLLEVGAWVSPNWGGVARVLSGPDKGNNYRVEMWSIPVDPAGRGSEYGAHRSMLTRLKGSRGLEFASFHPRGNPALPMPPRVARAYEAAQYAERDAGDALEVAVANLRAGMGYANTVVKYARQVEAAQSDQRTLEDTWNGVGSAGGWVPPRGANESEAAYKRRRSSTLRGGDRTQGQRVAGVVGRRANAGKARER